MRKKLIDDIIRKHRMIKVKPKVDTRRIRAKKYEKKKRKKKRVVGSKVRRKKSTGKGGSCPECGDFHFKKRGATCKIRDLKVNMLVNQIMNSSDEIKVIFFVMNDPICSVHMSIETFGHFK